MMNPDEELVVEPFARLVERGKLLAVPYNGFWQSMDTFKDKTRLDGSPLTGRPPWQLWTT